MVVFLNVVVLLVSLLFMAGPGVIATPVHELVLRQVSAATSATKNTTAISSDVIPSACTSQCSSDTLSALTSCTSSGCECTNDVYSGVTGCLECVVTNNGLTNATGQQLLAEYATTCSTLGVQLADAVSAAYGLRVFSVGVVGTMMATLVLSMFA
ncbi:hypothetical protein GGU11DRAFT_810912 [Lentinula aff. detonsa]|uniref:Extracellular membrane protein CFEM domain-containing protein n=1 Tax=Lentinula aff. detonsa TaxID=2804958 RepID=A0AA38NNP0_9AGAR|nr:hypothetical protein GGU10DRAFT_345577 [Lentinula aff. detonsa]KAJ3794875.1 hypothetical protein GGU11DRAFT_810912 [Lentinula aff. detonsa]